MNRIAVALCMILPFIPLLLPTASLLAQSPADTVDLHVSPGCWVKGENDKDIYIISFHLDVPAPSAITLRVTFGGSARNGEDYRQNDTTMMIVKGDRNSLLLGWLVDDVRAEEIERIEIRTSVIDGPARLVDLEPARLYILDNEQPPHNLLAAPGFESQPASWTMGSHGGTIATGRAKSGLRALLLEGSDEFSREVHQDVDIVPGMNYLYAVNRSIDDIDTIAPIAELIWLDDQGSEIGREVMKYSSFDGASTGWSYTSGCVVAPDAARRARFRLSLAIERDGEGEIRFDDLGLYAAEMATDVRDAEPNVRRLDLSLSDEPAGDRSD